MKTIEEAKAYIVGGGIASLSTAVLLIRDGGLRRTKRRWLGVALALVACGGGGGSDDGATPSDGAALVDAGGAAAGEKDAATSATTCAPACEENELCCVDAHGHLPRCVGDATCPSGFKPANEQ